ncbi:Progestin and adipoQ receptor family member 4 [Frankliniella fusca]|uniref:Progestin and adipoQ receptor family member 4 n=1 Tax=Frankliniella fusca TaxID=407009 RepID=A0AAE1HNN5_9NEOP|nr:Progestin and adipoQ receptor family member 4 [Frankliniella fusca]
MPPQGPPGPQPQLAERVAAAAMSAPVPAPAAARAPAPVPVPVATSDNRQQQPAGDDGLASLASRVANGSSDAYDQSVLRRRRDPDGDQVVECDVVQIPAAPAPSRPRCSWYCRQRDAEFLPLFLWQVFCPPEDASPVQDGAKGASSACPAAMGNNGYVQAKPAAPRCDEEPAQPDEREVSERGLLETGAVDGKPKLLTFDDVPQHLQFNPYIVTGYRPMSNFWGSLRSLFYLHNETVNIVTHGKHSAA